MGAHKQGLASAQAARGAGQGVDISRSNTEEQEFYSAAGLPVSPQPGLQDSGVVDDKQVAGGDQRHQVADLQVLEGSIARRNTEQFAPVPTVWRKAGDGVVWEWVGPLREHLRCQVWRSGEPVDYAARPPDGKVLDGA